MSNNLFNLDGPTAVRGRKPIGDRVLDGLGAGLVIAAVLAAIGGLLVLAVVSFRFVF